MQTSAHTGSMWPEGVADVKRQAKDTDSALTQHTCEEISRLEEEKEEWSRLALARLTVERAQTQELEAQAEHARQQMMQIQQLKSLIGMLETRLRQQGETFHAERVQLIRKHHANIESSKEASMQETSKLLTQLSMAEEQIRSLKALVAQKETAITASCDEKKKLLDALDQQNEKEEGLLARIKALEKQRSAAVREVEAKNTKVAQMLDHVNRLKAHLAREKLRVSTEQKTSTELQSELDTLKGSISRKCAKDPEDERKMRELEATHEALKQRNNVLMQEIDIYKSKCKKSEKFEEFVALKTENYFLHGEITRLLKLAARKSSTTLNVRLSDAAHQLKTPRRPMQKKLIKDGLSRTGQAD